MGNPSRAAKPPVDGTGRTDAVLLSEVRPEIVTAFAASGAKSLATIKASLPDSDVLGVTALSNLDDNDAFHIYGSTSTLGAALKLAHQARRVGLGVVCAPAEVEFVRDRYEGTTRSSLLVCDRSGLW